MREYINSQSEVKKIPHSPEKSNIKPSNRSKVYHSEKKPIEESFEAVSPVLDQQANVTDYKFTAPKTRYMNVASPKSTSNVDHIKSTLFLLN